MQTYGNISDKELKEATNKIGERVFNITQSLVGMYNKVEDLEKSVLNHSRIRL